MLSGKQHLSQHAFLRPFSLLCLYTLSLYDIPLLTHTPCLFGLGLWLPDKIQPRQRNDQFHIWNKQEPSVFLTIEQQGFWYLLWQCFFRLSPPSSSISFLIIRLISDTFILSVRKLDLSQYAFSLNFYFLMFLTHFLLCFFSYLIFNHSFSLLAFHPRHSRPGTARNCFIPTVGKI